MPVYNYSKLRGRIVERFGTMSAFADSMGITKQTLSKKLNGRSGLSQRDIECWSNQLGVSEDDLVSYFFAKNVSKS